MRNKTNKERD